MYEKSKLRSVFDCGSEEFETTSVIQKISFLGDSFEDLLNYYLKVAKPDWLSGLPGALMVLAIHSQEVDDYIKGLRWEKWIFFTPIDRMAFVLYSYAIKAICLR